MVVFFLLCLLFLFPLPFLPVIFPPFGNYGWRAAVNRAILCGATALGIEIVAKSQSCDDTLGESADFLS